MSSSDRPAIPAELRRQVLIEAGHRCAIHTCRHVEVDVHHIEPWAQTRAHRFENLIALCPNCHRLAEEGKIDRKSLRLYKARLAAAFRFEEINLYPEETVLPSGFAWVDPSGGWITKAIYKKTSQVEITLEYPQFRGATLGTRTKSVNRLIRNDIDDCVKRFFQLATESSDGLSRPFYLESSFSITLLRSTLLSIRFTMTSYTGGAHGARWTEARNVLTAPVKAFGIHELFTDPEVGVATLSRYAVEELLKTSTTDYARDEQWVRSGAGPDPKNFKSFNLTSRGVLLTFDEYQVGSYAEGASEVHVPYAIIARVLAPTVAVEVIGSGD